MMKRRDTAHPRRPERRLDVGGAGDDRGEHLLDRRLRGGRVEHGATVCDEAIEVEHAVLPSSSRGSMFRQPAILRKVIHRVGQTSLNGSAGGATTASRPKRGERGRGT